MAKILYNADLGATNRHIQNDPSPLSWCGTVDYGRKANPSFVGRLDPQAEWIEPSLVLFSTAPFLSERFSAGPFLQKYIEESPLPTRAEDNDFLGVFHRGPEWEF